MSSITNRPCRSPLTRVFLGCAIAALLSGCFFTSRVASESSVSAQSASTSARVPLVTLRGADSKAPELGYYLAADAEEWTYIWKRHRGVDASNADYDHYYDPLSLPVVDFDRCLVLAVQLGPKYNSAGVKIVDVHEDDERVRVRFDEYSYQTMGPDGGAVKANPYGFFVLPRTRKPIVLEENTQSMIRGEPIWTKRHVFRPGSRARRK